jgi:hypothetical protein
VILHNALHAQQIEQLLRLVHVLMEPTTTDQTLNVEHVPGNARLARKRSIIQSSAPNALKTVQTVPIAIAAMDSSQKAITVLNARPFVRAVQPLRTIVLHVQLVEKNNLPAPALATHTTMESVRPVCHARTDVQDAVNLQQSAQAVQPIEGLDHLAIACQNSLMTGPLPDAKHAHSNATHAQP